MANTGHLILSNPNNPGGGNPRISTTGQRPMYINAITNYQ